jgi:hypothetical protein
MSWIFHEPLEPAIYARRTVGRPVPPASRASGQHARVIVSLEALDVWRDETETWVTQRRAFAPLVARRGFSGTARLAELDLFTEDVATAQRRAFAPSAVRRSFRRPLAAYCLDSFAEEPWTVPWRAHAPVHAMASVRPYSPAGCVLASLLAVGAFGDPAEPTPPKRHYQAGYTPVVDVGLSASFSVTFTGKGDDPYGPVRVSTATGSALGADTLRQLAVQNPAVFGGTSASRTV